MKSAKMRAGFTPGVPAPGDPYYMSTLCKTKPTALLSHSVTLFQTDGSQPRSQKISYVGGRTLLSKKQSKKFRPPAWSDNHVNGDDIEFLENLISEFSNFCPFLVKNCVAPETNYIFQRRGIRYNESISHDVWEALPDIREGEWGSCALVGLGDNLLDMKSGEEIDSHDVVIRLGELPTARYKAFVGTKTDAIWVRRKAKMSNSGTTSSEHKARRWYIGHNNGNTDVPALKIFAHNLRVKEGHTIVDSDLPQISLYNRFVDKKWSKQARTKKIRKPSSGFSDAILLIASKFCQRLDLYGFSSNCGGAYYNPRHLMQMTHNCELESWFFHYLMKNHKEYGLCVYA